MAQRDWDSGLYDRFGDERQRAAADLLAAISGHAFSRITDLGCGSGLSTALLARRWPEAAITAIDTSADMLAKAHERQPGPRYLQGNIAEFNPETPQDLLFANASLHWLGDHDRLMPQLLCGLNPGGVLALQMPDNLDEPSHRLMDDVAREQPFAEAIGTAPPRRHELLTPEAYYDALIPHCASINLWRTRYLHRLPNVDAIADWFASTGLKPYLDALPDSQRTAFRSRYVQRLADCYGVRADGSVLLAMPRLFIVATTRPRTTTTGALTP